MDLFNKVRVGNIDDDEENLLKASGENYPKDVFHMYAENEPAMKRNKVALNDLSGELYTTEANGIVPDNYKYPSALIEAAQN